MRTVFCKSWGLKYVPMDNIRGQDGNWTDNCFYRKIVGKLCNPVAAIGRKMMTHSQGRQSINCEVW